MINLNCYRLPIQIALLVVSTYHLTALALEEDAQQKIDFNALSSELFLDEGLVVHHGSIAEPACIIQGSMQICGLEIRIQRHNGELQNIIATGTPAHFQQRPAPDKALILASAETLVFDNIAQTVSMEKMAELIQEENVLKSYHILYDIKARKFDANSAPDGDQVRMSIPPAAPATP